MTDRIGKFINSLDKKTKEKLKARLKRLKESPYKAGDVKKLSGYGDDLYRLRMGKIRIIYRFIDSEIEVVDIDYRGNIY